MEATIEGLGCFVRFTIRSSMAGLSSLKRTCDLLNKSEDPFGTPGIYRGHIRLVAVTIRACIETIWETPHIVPN